MNAKTLEMIIRAKDETSGPMKRAGQGTMALMSNLKALNRELLRAQQTRAAGRSAGQQALEKAQVKTLEREIALGNEKARVELQNLQINQQYAAQRKELLAITRSDLAGTENRRQAYKALIDLEHQRTRAIQAAAQARQHEVQQAQLVAQAQRKEARQGVQNELGAQRVAYLQQEASLGNVRAKQELELLQINQRYQTQQRAMLAVMYNQQASDRQRAAAKVQLIRLEEQRRRAVLAVAHAETLAANEAQRAARAKMIGGARAIAGGAFGGATMAMGSALPGLLGGGLIAGAGPAGAAAAGVGALAYGMAQAVKTAATFEHAMSRVRALTRATGKDWEDLQAEAMRLGATTVFTANQVADAMSEMAQAGYSANKILAATEPALQLAAAGRMDIAQATEIVTKIMSGMRLEAKELPAVVDVLVKAFSSAHTNLVELGDAMAFVGPFAKAVNRDLSETTATIQMLSDAGIAGEMAGTTFRQILISLISPSAAARSELKKLGVDILDAQGNVRPLADIIDNLNASLSGLGDGQKGDVLGRIFEARSLSGINVLLSKTGDTLRDMIGKLNDAHGTSQAIADIQLDNLTGSVIKLQSVWESLMITMGNTSAPRAAVDAIAWMLGEHQKNFEKYGAAAALAPVAIWGTASRMGMSDTSHESQTLQRKLMDMRQAQSEAQALLQQRAMSAGRSIADQQTFDQQRDIANNIADATLNADGLKDALDQIRQRENGRADAQAHYLDQLRQQTAELQTLSQLTDADDAKHIAARQHLLTIEQEIARVESERAQTRQDSLQSEQAARLRDLARAGGPLGVDAQKKLAAIEIDADMRQRHQSLMDIVLGKDSSSDQRHQARLMMDQLIKETPGRKQKAADDIDNEIALKRTASLRAIDDQLQAGRLALLKEQAALGDKAADAEARRLEIATEYQNRRMAILKLLKDEHLTQSQKDESLKQLHGLDQSEAAALAASRRPPVFDRTDPYDARLQTSKFFAAHQLTSQRDDPARQTAGHVADMKKELAEVKNNLRDLIDIMKERGEDIPQYINIDR